jgi:hypothetical protein
MANSNNRNRNVINNVERSIGTLNQNIINFGKTIDTLVDSINTFQSSVGTNSPTPTSSNRNPNPKKGKKLRYGAREAYRDKTRTQLSKFDKDMAHLGMKRINDFTNNVFGKRATEKLNKAMARGLGYINPRNVPGGGGGIGGAMRSAGGMGTRLGSVLRMAGPAAAILGVAKQAFDFWDSGGVAKLNIGAKMLTGNKMTGAEDIASVQKDLEGTEQMRKLNAEYNYIIPLQLKQQAADDMFDYNKGIEQDQLSYQQGLVKDKLDYQLGLTKDALNFQLQQAMETLDAELEKRKAIQSSGMKFITKYSTISERALKAVGSSTKAIIEGIAKFQSVFGGSVKDSFKLNEQAAGLSYHLGGSADDVMNMTNLFRLMGNTSAEMAQNLIGGIEAFAKQNLLSPQAIFNQIKDAGEDIYKFSSGTADNFVKQAGLLTKMSVSMSQMMKASDSMVLNYQDSIKAEMSLSAMLGRNVNLSEVRARLMSNDTPGAASALKFALSGIDIGSMNPFQKQALTQATGMDISALMGLQQGEGGALTGELKAEENKGKVFADAALKQDISNAGAKLRLEQEQRAKLLAFEQRQRLIMLNLEQAQRLDGIFLEQKYRVLAADKNFEQSKEMVVAEMMKDVAANFAVNLASGTASAFNSKNLPDVTYFTRAVGKFDDKVTNLMSSGAIKGTDMRLADYLSKKDSIMANVSKKTAPADVEKRMQNLYTNIFGNEELNLQRTIANQKSEPKVASKPRPTWWDSMAKAYAPLSALPQQESSKKLLAGIVSNNTVSTKSTVTAIASTGQKQISKQTESLTESQYSNKIQNEMVALLAVNATLLERIVVNTNLANGVMSINLDGATLNKKLLANTRKNYSINR